MRTLAVTLAANKNTEKRNTVTVYNFGSINIDYVYQVERFVQPGETLASLQLETVLGGKGANQSVALARAGAEVFHLGRVGSGDRWALDALQSFGVDTGLVEVIDGNSGHAIIQVDANGENAIVLHGGANQSFDADSITGLLSNAAVGDWLLIQNECNALEVMFNEAKQKQLRMVFNPAPMTNSVKQLPLQLCEILILNEIEAAQLADTNDVNKMEAQLHSRYPDTQIVLTLGSAGAQVLFKGEKYVASSTQVSVVDTTGAGDTFVGFYLASQIQGMPIQQALERACAAGSLAVTKAGATPSIPTSSEVDNMLNRSSS